MPETETVYFVGPGPDALNIPISDGSSVTAERDGDGVKVPADVAKSLLARDDFQSSKPTRSAPKVEREKE